MPEFGVKIRRNQILEMNPDNLAWVLDEVRSQSRTALGIFNSMRIKFPF